MLMRFAFTLAAMLLAAGCIGGQPPTPTTTMPPPTTPPTPPTACARDESGACCPDLGCKAPKSCEAMPDSIECRHHEHDYWDGETRRTVFSLESSLVPLPLIPCRRPGCTADDPAGDDDNYPLGTAIADYDIPPPAEGGGLIYEGTGSIEVLLNWASPPLAGPDTAHPAIHVMFDFLTSADEPGAFRPGGELKPGSPVVVPVLPLEADMPHQTKSLWVFRIYTAEPNAFDFNLTVTAVKGGEVAEWPPHPDPFAERAERVIFDGEQTLASKGSHWYWIDGSNAGWQFPEHVISWGTDRLDVTVSDVSFTTQVGAPPEDFVLEYHNASFVSKMGNGDQAGGRAEAAARDGATWSYRIDVDPQGYDTPYGAKSRWGFRLAPRYDDEGATCPEGTEEVLAGCQPFPYTLRYRIVIVAKGHPLSEAA